MTILISDTTDGIITSETAVTALETLKTTNKWLPTSEIENIINRLRD